MRHRLRPWRFPAALAGAFVAGALSHALLLAPERAAAQAGTITRSQKPVIDCPLPEDDGEKARVRMLKARVRMLRARGAELAEPAPAPDPDELAEPGPAPDPDELAEPPAPDPNAEE